MKFKINSDIEIIEQSNDLILLHNLKSDKLFEINIIVYHIIKEYIKTNDIEYTLASVKDDIKLSYTEINDLVIDAKNAEIIVEDYYQTKQTTINPVIDFLLNHISFIRPILSYVKPIYKVFTFQFSNKVWKFIFYFSVFILNFISIYFFVQLIDFHGIQKGLIVVFFISFTAIFHELGHVIAYKTLFNRNDEKLGFGLMYYFYPILFINTPSLYFTKEKGKKILYSIAGSLFDTINLIVLFYFNMWLGVYFILIRIVLNLIPLLGVNDGYFIYKDCFNKVPLERLTNDKLTYEENFQFNLKQIFNKHLLSFLFIWFIRLGILFIYIYFFKIFLLKEIMYYFVLN